MLTVEMLKKMEPWEIFEEGIKTYNGKRIKWVAVRGRGYWDWAIYYMENVNATSEDVAGNGRKIYDPDDFVKFDEEAGKLYRM